MREQVEAGVLPRQALYDAERRLQQSRDEAILKETLYGSLSVEELTEQQAGEMTAAAARLADRNRQEWQKANRLVTEGVLSRAALEPYREDFDRSRKTLDIARERAALFRELAEIATAEQTLQQNLEESADAAAAIADHFGGDGAFRPSQLDSIRVAFEKEFQRPLPVSARGETALHRSLGFDHRGRVDVALHPDQTEGRWLLRRLAELRIPYFAFRMHVAGKSTGAHIHIGPQSVRFRRAD